MIVIFGHSPIFGFLNTVQEYNFGTREWRVVTTRGYPVKGGYGHSASYDPLTELIYVYGGIISESESAQLLSNKLYSYEPRTSTWTMLVPAATARYLHTANFISPGLMLVVSFSNRLLSIFSTIFNFYFSLEATHTMTHPTASELNATAMIYFCTTSCATLGIFKLCLKILELISLVSVTRPLCLKRNCIFMEDLMAKCYQI